MANYLIVVPRGNSELFDLLSVAFRGDDGFRVVIDRREPASALPGDDLHETDRRSPHVTPGPDEIVVAESAEQSDRLGHLLVTA
jgi:hypothetical protein